MTLRYRLPRSARLQKKCEFDAVRAEGSRIALGCLIVNWMKVTGASGCRLGIVVGRKVGCAVARNRARRLLREVFRHHQHDLSDSAAVVLVARPSINEKAYAAVERDFLAAMGEAGLLKAAE
ncbi:MAG: ribonuclease P protein component [Verrucomicrobiota bacterium]|nr:ribonuclease P protein component [Verrucomicrobiota bacterium]